MMGMYDLFEKVKEKFPTVEITNRGVWHRWGVLLYSIPLLFSGRAEVKVNDWLTVLAENGYVWFLVRGFAAFKLSSGVELVDALAVALLHRQLLRQGVDVFKLLEEQLGRPGHFDKVKEFLNVLADRVEGYYAPDEEFISGMRRLRKAMQERMAAEERVKELARARLPLPVPNVNGEVEVRVAVKEVWETPPRLKPLLGERKVSEELRVIAFNDIVTDGFDLFLLSSRGTALSDLITATLVYHHLLQQGVDFLALLEEKLGAPGLYNDLRTVMNFAASVLADDC
ncbi:MAG: hypothetical protein QXU69_11785 [Thermofilaceae archaeon]